MKKKIFIGSICCVLLCLVIIFALAFGFPESEVDKINVGRGEVTDIHEFEVNERGQTFGYSQTNEDATPLFPDLVFAIGVDGTEGYVLLEDLNANGPLQRPRNPEEAMLYMEQLNGIEGNGDYLYYIPIYASDGVTVIGTFGISAPSTGYDDFSTVTRP